MVPILDLLTSLRAELRINVVKVVLEVEVGKVTAIAARTVQE